MKKKKKSFLLHSWLNSVWFENLFILERSDSKTLIERGIFFSLVVVREERTFWLFFSPRITFFFVDKMNRMFVKYLNMKKIRKASASSFNDIETVEKSFLVVKLKQQIAKELSFSLMILLHSRPRPFKKIRSKLEVKKQKEEISFCRTRTKVN